MSNKFFLLVVIVASVLLVDQWSKQLAVRYLRSPDHRDSRDDFYADCTKRFNACKRRCLRETRHSGSYLACEKTCKRRQKRCRDLLQPALERARRAWEERLKAMKSSFLCRKVLSASSTHPECVVLENYFHFVYRTNTGAAWGIFGGLDSEVRRPFFISITLIAILFIFYLFAFRLESEHRLMIVALALILGGALGNFLDRLRLDYVIDFIEWFWRLRIPSRSWPTFNIADAAITIGVLLIAVELFFFAPPDDDLELPEQTGEPEETKPPKADAMTPTSSTTTEVKSAGTPKADEPSSSAKDASVASEEST